MTDSVKWSFHVVMGVIRISTTHHAIRRQHKRSLNAPMRKWAVSVGLWECLIQNHNTLPQPSSVLVRRKLKQNLSSKPLLLFLPQNISTPANEFWCHSLLLRGKKTLFSEASNRQAVESNSVFHIPNIVHDLILFLFRINLFLAACQNKKLY